MAVAVTNLGPIPRYPPEPKVGMEMVTWQKADPDAPPVVAVPPPSVRDGLGSNGLATSVAPPPQVDHYKIELIDSPIELAGYRSRHAAIPGDRPDRAGRLRGEPLRSIPNQRPAPDHARWHSDGGR